MSKKVWYCQVCGKEFKTERSAQRCEEHDNRFWQKVDFEEGGLSVKIALKPEQDD